MEILNRRTVPRDAARPGQKGQPGQKNRGEIMDGLRNEYTQFFIMLYNN